MHRERTYPVPLRLQTPLLGAAASMSDIDTFIEGGYGDQEERAWALNVRSKFVNQNLDRVCGPTGRLPIGLVKETGDVDVVIALGFNEELFWNGTFSPTPPQFDSTIELNTEEVAFSIDALEHGSSGLALRAGGPIAVIGRAAVAAESAGPANAKFFAVVDPDDRAAVMELLAIAPGPVIFRRHDGSWQPDNAWLRALKSVKPPPVVTLDPEMLKAVLSQVDEATKGKPFSGAVASGMADHRLVEMEAEFFALTAAMPAKLQRYWLTGPGAAKIRWFTPGSWKRCYRQLVKYMNPYSAKGACTNLSQKLGGPGVATHVGR
jgi:hypothetical protein